MRTTLADEDDADDDIVWTRLLTVSSALPHRSHVPSVVGILCSYHRIHPLSFSGFKDTHQVVQPSPLCNSRTFSSAPKKRCTCQRSRPFLPSPQPRQPLMCLLSLWLRLCRVFHGDGLQCVALRVGLFPLSGFPRSVRVLTRITAPLLVIAKYCPMVRREPFWSPIHP